MNRDIFEGKWKQLKGVAREKWGKLTDDELDTIQGRMDRFAGLLQERYGYARDKAEEEIEAWMNDTPVRGIRSTSHSWLLLLLLPALGFGSACMSRDATSPDEIQARLAELQATSPVEASAVQGSASEPEWVPNRHSEDALITLAVKNKLGSDPAVQGLRLSLHTRKGIVHLSGIVRDAAARDRAVSLARETESVRGVRANIAVIG